MKKDQRKNCGTNKLQSHSYYSDNKSTIDDERLALESIETCQ